MSTESRISITFLILTSNVYSSSARAIPQVFVTHVLQNYIRVVVFISRRMLICPMGEELHSVHNTG